MSLSIARPSSASLTSGVGSSRHVDAPLRLEHLGQMRVAVDGDPVGTGGDHGVEGPRESARRLSRQAVDQIDVDRAQTVPTAGVDDRKRFLDGLHAVHRRLYRRVEILDAEACAVEADRRKLAHIAGGNRARIELDRNVAVAAVGEWNWRRSVSTASPNCAGARKFGVPRRNGAG
jgi:hypothetical protein